ncbi:hypothetical protein D3C71_1803320 [compost metagenome]
MPTPVSTTFSRTVWRSPSCGSASTWTWIDPRSVNRIAFDTKLFKICFNRNGSTECARATLSGRSIVKVRSSPFAAAIGWNTSTTSSVNLHRLVGCGRNWNFPASILDRSNRSPISASSDWDAL